MISTKVVWDRINVLSKNGTSGYQTEDEFNSDLNAVQLELATMLLPLYEKNQQVSDALSPFITYEDKTASVTGEITKNENYLGLATIWLFRNNAYYPTHKLALNEVSVTRTSPIRMPSVAKNEACYYFVNDKIVMLPEQNLTVRVFYLKQPDTASIELIPVSDEDRDYMTVGDVVDLKWPQSMFNMIVYMMLEKLGLEMKESLLLEMSQLGIQKNMITTNPA